MEIVLSNYGNVIATDEKSQEVYDNILSALKKGESVSIDAKGVTISTKSARLIFGRLYKQFTTNFVEKVKLLNASSLFMFSVNEGIATEMEN